MGGKPKMTGTDDSLLEDLGVPEPFEVDAPPDEETPARFPIGGPVDVTELGGEETPVSDGGMFPGLPSCCDANITDDLGFEPVDPATIRSTPEADTIIGDPAGATDYWLYQGEGNGTCAPTSVTMMLSRRSGRRCPTRWSSSEPRSSACSSTTHPSRASTRGPG
jgi:hypothetical protein